MNKHLVFVIIFLPYLPIRLKASHEAVVVVYLKFTLIILVMQIISYFKFKNLFALLYLDIESFHDGVNNVPPLNHRGLPML